MKTRAQLAELSTTVQTAIQTTAHALADLTDLDEGRIAIDAACSLIAGALINMGILSIGQATALREALLSAVPDIVQTIIDETEPETATNYRTATPSAN